MKGQSCEPRRRCLRDRLELVRIFLCPSAVADSHAGLALAAALASRDPGWVRIAGMAGLSVLAYSAGMVLNDVFDAAKDAARAPRRPIPSGRVSGRGAAALAAALAVGAAILGAALGILPLTLALLGLIVAYDAGGKKVPGIGVVLMGLCRGANFLAGAACVLGQGTAAREAEVLAGAGLLATWVAAVTSASRLEDVPHGSGALAARAALAACVPVALIALRPADPVLWVHGAALLAVLALAFREGKGTVPVSDGARPGPRVPSTGNGDSPQAFVGRALSGIYLVDAAAFLALRPEGSPWARPVIAIDLLAILAWLWRRAWMRRGGEGS